MAETRCPSCGYTKKDAQINGDHRLCKNAGNAPWEKVTETRGSTNQMSVEQINALAQFNSESARGIVHTDQWKAWMEELQTRFDAEREKK